MNESSRRKLLLSMMYGAVETLFILPIWFLALFFTTNQAFLYLWLLTVPLVYATGGMLISRVKKNRRLYRMLIGAALGAVHTLILLALLSASQAELPGVLAVIPVLLAAFMATRGMSAWTKGWNQSFPNMVMVVSILFYVILTIAAHLQEKLQPYFSFLTICGILALVLLLYVVNERLLTSETQSGGAIQSSTTKVFKRQNRFMLTVVAVLLLIAGLFRQLQSSIESLFHTIVNKFLEWMNGSGEPTPDTPAEPQPPPPNGLPPVEANDPPTWLVWLEYAAKFIGIALLVLGITVLLFIIGRKLYKLISKMMARFWERAESGKDGADGYTDEVESLVDRGKWSVRLGRSNKKQKEAKWEELSTAGEKLRYLYRKYVSAAIGRGYGYKPYYTARETASDIEVWQNRSQAATDVDMLTRLYDEVRYGGQEPSEDLVQSLKKRLDEQKR